MLLPSVNHALKIITTAHAFFDHPDLTTMKNLILSDPQRGKDPVNATPVLRCVSVTDIPYFLSFRIANELK
jgi:hypothetical protein